jgi:L-2,4-diaminobutyrate transaminase
MQHAGVVGAYMLARLRDSFLDHDYVGDVRGAGLLAAIEFVADKTRPRAFNPAFAVGQRLATACRHEGVIVRPLPHGDILGFSPPLIVTEQDIDEIVTRVERGVLRGFNELKKDGVV